MLNEHFCTCNLYHKTCHVIMLLAAAIRMETCVFAVNTIIWNAIRAEIDWQCGERVKERVWNFVSNHTLASLWNYLWNFNKCSPLNNYTNAFLLLLSLSLSTSSNLSLNIHCLICILCVCDKKRGKITTTIHSSVDCIGFECDCALCSSSDIINVSAFYYMCWTRSLLLSSLTWIITGKN